MVVVDGLERRDVAAVPVRDVVRRRLFDLRQLHRVRDDRVERDVVAGEERAVPARPPEDGDHEARVLEREQAQPPVERVLEGRVDVRLAERERGLEVVAVLQRVLDEARALAVLGVLALDLLLDAGEARGRVLVLRVVLEALLELERGEVPLVVEVLLPLPKLLLDLVCTHYTPTTKFASVPRQERD